MYVLELGGEDDAFAAREAESACSAVERLAPGLATARGISERVRSLAYTHRAAELVGTGDPTVDSAVALLEAATLDREASDARPEGVRPRNGRTGSDATRETASPGTSERAAPASREGTVAVRARDVRGLTGVSTREAEQALGGVLTDRGFAVDLDDPDHELRALFSGGVCCLGWLAAESVRDFGDRKPTDRPFFQPGSMDPLLARALANVAGARPGSRLLDPMCGTGGVLVEAGLVGADVLGTDAQRKMVRGARRNLARYLESSALGEPGDERSESPNERTATGGSREPGDFDLLRGDATRLPLRDGAVDAVVFDAPYGRQSKIANRSLEDLVADALGEARRVAPRAVVVGDRDWRDAATEAGWTVESRFERRVHRSLDRHVLVLE